MQWSGSLGLWGKIKQRVLRAAEAAFDEEAASKGE
jgi:hypothetical protein